MLIQCCQCDFIAPAELSAQAAIVATRQIRVDAIKRNGNKLSRQRIDYPFGKARAAIVVDDAQSKRVAALSAKLDDFRDSLELSLIRNKPTEFPPLTMGSAIGDIFGFLQALGTELDDSKDNPKPIAPFDIHFALDCLGVTREEYLTMQDSLPNTDDANDGIREVSSRVVVR